MPTRHSNEEKMKFLREILKAKVDVTITEKWFGKPYIPGDMKVNDTPEDPTSHHTYWVRDIRDQLPGFPDAGRIGNIPSLPPQLQ
jgi:hypothetical protein